MVIFIFSKYNYKQKTTKQNPKHQETIVSFVTETMILKKSPKYFIDERQRENSKCFQNVYSKCKSLRN